MPKLSPDGYIRLPLADFMEFSFLHFYSESDADLLQELRAKTIPARLAGFTEWKSESSPTISIGWTWFIHDKSNAILLAPDRVRSNLMLRDVQGYDLGPQNTAELLSAWLNIFNWTETVRISVLTSENCQV